MKLSEKIKEYRERAGLTQEELAERMNVQRNTVWRWENQKANLKADSVQKLSAILNVAPADLMESCTDTAVKNVYVDANMHTTEKISNRNMATVTLKDGSILTAPATQEGFAFLKDLYAMDHAYRLNTEQGGVRIA